MTLETERSKYFMFECDLDLNEARVIVLMLLEDYFLLSISCEKSGYKGRDTLTVVRVNDPFLPREL